MKPGKGPNEHPLGLTKAEIAKIADGWSHVLSPQQAADMIGAKLKTIYGWSHQERLRGCARRRGKHLLIFRDRFLTEIFNGREW